MRGDSLWDSEIEFLDYYLQIVKIRTFLEPKNISKSVNNCKIRKNQIYKSFKLNG